MIVNYKVILDYNINKDSGQYKSPINQIANEARVYTPADTSIVTPNSDTPYSMVQIDLRSEPMVISVPKWKRKDTMIYSLLICTQIIMLCRQPYNR
ncbi:MAG: DUF1254 domain-containing protein [Ignavibacteria bacterium]